MKFAINQAVKIINGKYEEAVGIVLSRKEIPTPEQKLEGHYKVHISGILKNKKLEVVQWFDENQLEGLK